MAARCFLDGERSKVQGTAQANRNLLGFSGHLSKDGLHVVFGAPMFGTQAGYVLIQYRKDRETDKFNEYMKTADTLVY